MEEYKRQTDELKGVKDRLEQYRDAANTRKSDNALLIEEIKIAKKVFSEALQDELLSQTESNSKVEQIKIRVNTATLLMDFLKYDQLPELRSAEKIKMNKQSI